MKHLLTLATASLLSCQLHAKDPAWPSVTLSNGAVKMISRTPGLPESFYRGGRFVHCAMLDEIEAGGASFYIRHHTGAHNPLGHDSVCGPAEEFDLNTPPPGYAEAEGGGLFLKIGVGVLRRPADEKEYAFYKTYEIADPGVWTTEAPGGNEVIYRHTVALPDKSYAVEYEHRVSLADGAPVARVTRTLRNTGEKEIATRHYNHQFLAINTQPIGAAYTLELGFAPLPKEQLGDILRITENKIEFTRDLTKTLWSPMTGFGDSSEENRFTLRLENGAAVHYSTDRPIADVCLYATPRVICPEFFTDLRLAPGSETPWSSELRFEPPK